MEISGLSGSDGGVGLTTAEMMDPYDAWRELSWQRPEIGFGCPVADYPRLAWEVARPGQIIPDPDLDYLGWIGTSESRYRIDTGGQLIFLGKASILWESSLSSDADINLAPTCRMDRFSGRR